MTEKQERIYDILLTLETKFVVDLFLNYQGTQILDIDFIEFINQELEIEEDC